MKPALVVWGQGFSSTSSGGKKKQFDVRAVGEGSIGDIKVGHKRKIQCKFLKSECLEKELHKSNKELVLLNLKRFYWRYLTVQRRSSV